MKTFVRGGYAEPGSSLQYHTGSWRISKPIYKATTAPCAGGCPAGENAQQWLGLMDSGKPQQAWQAITAANPLPAVTGRVCHHPCETACNRQHMDEAVSIHHVERYLGDIANNKKWQFANVPLAANAAKVAVVGAGPSGLAAAYHLRQQGVAVDLFDAAPEAGGMLRFALPQYRLPRDVLDQEIARILACGINFHPHKRLGQDIELNQLCSDYAAVYLALGTQKSQDWSVDGATPKDLHSGIDMLKEWMAVNSIPEAKSIAIIGGGNTAIDLARILRRSGSSEVHIITDQSLPGSSDDNIMSAIPREVSQAQEEGIVIHANRGIRRLILRGERVVGVELVHMRKLHSGATGFRRVAFEGTETVLHVDMVIPAIGQALDTDGINKLPLKNGKISLQSTGQVAGYDNLFAGGDMAPDCGSVTEAVGYGRRTANVIANFLRSGIIGDANREEASVIAYSQLNTNYFEPSSTVSMRVLPVEERLAGCAEIEQGITDKEAKAEAKRCLSCGQCIGCDNCWTLCPDMAVLKDNNPKHAPYVFDYDYCKGCGLCANECPCGYITMEDDL